MQVRCWSRWGPCTTGTYVRFTDLTDMCQLQNSFEGNWTTKISLLLKIQVSRMSHRVDWWNITDVSEDLGAFNFTVKKSNKRNNWNAICRRRRNHDPSESRRVADVSNDLQTFRKILLPLSLGSSNPRKGITGLLYPYGEEIMILRKLGKLPTFRTIYRRLEGFWCHDL